jgi:hypothetical protein
MIKEKGLVVPLKDMFTHPPILLQNDITMSRKDIPRSRAARNVLIQDSRHQGPFTITVSLCAMDTQDGKGTHRKKVWHQALPGIGRTIAQEVRLKLPEAIDEGISAGPGNRRTVDRRGLSQNKTVGTTAQGGYLL